MSLIERLEKYCLTPAMAGFEEEMIKKLKEDLKDHVDEIRVDVLGNVIATINGSTSGQSDLMIFAHTDSLGMIVKGIEANGFIRIERVGGVPERILAATNVILQPKPGEIVNGVIGFVSHHLTPPEDKYIVKPIGDCYVDIGATSAADLVAYAGHDAFMDFQVAPMKGTNGGKPRKAIVLAGTSEGAVPAKAINLGNKDSGSRNCWRR